MFHNYNQPSSASSSSSFHTDMDPLASAANLQIAPNTSNIHSKQTEHTNDKTDIRLNTMVQNFWTQQRSQLSSPHIDFKYHPLPLARVKKVMKADPVVKQMISSEAPLVFSKACEIFVAELTSRAWVIVEENKRRTLQRNDVITAMSKSDQYDFLVDIVPKDEHPKDSTKKSNKKEYLSGQSSTLSSTHLNSPVGYYTTQTPPSVLHASQQWDRNMPYPYMPNDGSSNSVSNLNNPYPMANTQYYTQNTSLPNNYTDPLLTPYQPPNQTYPYPFTNNSGSSSSLQPLQHRQETYNLGNNPLNSNLSSQHPPIPSPANILSSPPPFQSHQLPNLQHHPISSILDRNTADAGPTTNSSSTMLRPLNSTTLPSANTFPSSPTSVPYPNALGQQNYPPILPGVMPAAVQYQQNMDPAAATNAAAISYNNGLNNHGQLPPLLTPDSTSDLNLSLHPAGSSLNPSRRTSAAHNPL